MKFNRLAEVLAEKQKRGKELQELLNVSATTISMWKNNKSQPAIPMLFRIAKALDVSPRELLSINNPL